MAICTARRMTKYLSASENICKQLRGSQVTLLSGKAVPSALALVLMAPGACRGLHSAGKIAMTERVVNADTITTEDVRGAMDRGELFVEYQPIVSLADATRGRRGSVGTLAAWRHRVAGEQIRSRRSRTHRCRADSPTGSSNPSRKSSAHWLAGHSDLLYQHQCAARDSRTWWLGVRVCALRPTRASVRYCWRSPSAACPINSD